ncbi:protein FAR-RED IMPAIRED RESPONSE 1-like [Camellia sinensis]|uniref:protein FAR-RED IMPAIRED RESPONSE 1-like n=1 Tax=Camellia sinensis TaxID=4442 RepID=UPI001035C950|nr:protein FAR-RED IMPAIRED RESPONSE 1-like [Camellia sinensis]
MSGECMGDGGSMGGIDSGLMLNNWQEVVDLGCMVVGSRNDGVSGKVKSKGVDYNIPNKADDIHLINESRAKRCYGCEASLCNEEPTNINVEDGQADMKQQMVDDAHGDDIVEKRKTLKALTRVGYQAQFCIRYDPEDGEGGKYVVTHFIADHNHELAEQHCVMHLRSHRGLNSADKAQVMAMRNVSVKTSQIMDYMVNQFGCYENVGFIRTDLHNHIQAERRAEVEDGDAQGTLVYLCAKLDVDPCFFYKYDVRKDNKLQNLLWTDSKSRADYAKFGDVLIFDST